MPTDENIRKHQAHCAAMIRAAQKRKAAWRAGRRSRRKAIKLALNSK